MLVEAVFHFVLVLFDDSGDVFEPFGTIFMVVSEFEEEEWGI